METTTCKHEEQIEKVGRGIEHGTCKICHQVRQYNRQDLREKPKIIKLGRINGAIVLPSVNDSLLLATQEKDELEAAKKEQAELVHSLKKPGATEEQPPTSERPQSPGEKKGDQVAAAIPPRPKGRSLLLRQYFNNNKEAILKDYQNLKLQEFFAKWHICSGTWVKLKRGWGVPNKRKGLEPGLEHAAEALNKLPAFPAFNDSWPFIVQEKWLEVYKELRQIEAGVKQ